RFLTEYIMLGFNTGLRPSELFHLEGRNVDLPGKPVHVRRKPELGFHQKIHREREVPLNDHAFYAAASLEQRARASDFLFHHRDGSRVRSVRESFDTLVKRSHTRFGTRSERGASRRRSIREYWKLMGHSTLATLARSPGRAGHRRE